jgi:hypothetical protein
MKLFFLLIFFVLAKTLKISSVVSRNTDLKSWVNLVSVKSEVVNKVAVHEHVNNSLTNLPYFRPNGLDHTSWFCAQIK